MLRFLSAYLNETPKRGMINYTLLGCCCRKEECDAGDRVVQRNDRKTE